ncbi:hypothetical protein WKH55_08850 [Pantoea agglomerans]|uniref:hypothetical protein n=1 Tax=Enterobacter agglomerans TaxID=549 RepID=UPI003C7CEC14
MRLINLKNLSILIILVLISSPIFIYVINFYKLPFSEKTQDWANFASYVGGIYSAAFGLAGTIILCLTLYFTIKNNNIQIEHLKKESITNLFINYIHAFNEKLNKRKNTVNATPQYISYPTPDTEDVYIDKLKEKYKTTHLLLSKNSPASPPSPFEVAKIVLNELNVRYPQEITALLNVLSVLNSCSDTVFKLELIRLFHSLTYRDRTYWIMMYAFNVNEEAKKTIMRNPDLIAQADGLGI